MATTVVMPQMGYDMKEGTVVRWRKREGDGVSKGEIIAEIETDKAVVEMEAYASGVLRKIAVEEGKVVPVGQIIAVIANAEEELPPVEELTKQATPSAEPSTTSTAAAVAAKRKSVAAPTKEVRASPLARRLAREKGIDLTKVTGTGPGGRITETDLVIYTDEVAAAPGLPAEAVPTERVDLTRMRQAIARVTTQSKQRIPHFYVTAEIDMTSALDLRNQVNRTLQNEGRVSVNDIIIKAVTKVLERYPSFNASFHEGYLQMNPNINMGIAIALEQGLIVPAINNCQDKSLVEIAKASRDLIQRAQKGHLRADKYTGNTFSISNLGTFEVESFAAIILPPNAAVLAVGKVMERPVVRDGQIKVAQIMKGTISVDHRVADGAEAARFIGEVKSLLEHPATLLL